MATRCGGREPRGDCLALCFQDRKPELLAEKRLTQCIQRAMVELSLVHSSSLKLRTLLQLPLNWGRTKAKLLGYCVGMMVSPAVLESPAHCHHPSRLWAE